MEADSADVASLRVKVRGRMYAICVNGDRGVRVHLAFVGHSHLMKMKIQPTPILPPTQRSPPHGHTSPLTPRAPPQASSLEDKLAKHRAEQERVHLTREEQRREANAQVRQWN